MYRVFYYALDFDGTPYISSEVDFSFFDDAIRSIKDWENSLFEIAVDVIEDITYMKTVARSALTRSLFTSYIVRNS